MEKDEFSFFFLGGVLKRGYDIYRNILGLDVKGYRQGELWRWFSDMMGRRCIK